MPVKDSYSDRVFTTEVVSYPEMVHIGPDKDFTPVIEKALELGGYPEDHKMTGINGGSVLTTGFARGTVLSVADKVVEAVKGGSISHFFLVAAMTARSQDGTTTSLLKADTRRFHCPDTGLRQIPVQRFRPGHHCWPAKNHGCWTVQ